MYYQIILQTMDEISPKQLEANRQNALKHPIFRETITEYEKDLEENLLELLGDEFEPQGVIEKMLVDRIATCYLKLFRVAKAEKEYMQATLNPRVVISENTLLFPEDYIKVVVKNEGYVPRIGSGDIGRLSDVYLKYEAAIEDRLYKAIKELERIQTARLGGTPPPKLVIDMEK